MDQIRQVYPSIRPSDLQAVEKCFAENWFSEGPWCKAFAQTLREYMNVPYVTYAPNGTLGLFLALKALNLPQGSKVLIPDFTFFGSASSVVFAGLRPEFVDVDRETFQVDMKQLEKKLNDPAVSAVMAIHIYGQCCEIDAIAKLCQSRGVKLIEDAAQAVGVFYDGQHAGTFGDVGVFSLYADKTLSSGEGAIVVTKDEALFDSLLYLRNQGRKTAGRFYHPQLGMNFRITDMQAAIAYSGFQRLEEMIAAKQRRVERYRTNLSSCNGLSTMRIDPRSTVAPFRYPLVCVDRDAVAAALEANGIEKREFFMPMHMQPPLAEYVSEPCPSARYLFEHGLCLPVHDALTDADIDYICDVVRKVVD